MKNRLIALLRWSERYTKTDMVYLAQSGFWSNLSSVSVTLFSLALYLVFAHFLTKETYGTYQYLLSLGALVGSLTLTGMNTSVAQAVARGFEGTLKKSVAFQLRWAALPFFVASIGSAYYFIAGNNTLGIGLLLIGVGIPLINTFNTYSALLLGRKDFRHGFVFNFWINILFYGALITTAIVSEEPLTLIGVNLFVQTLAYISAYLAVLHVSKPSDAVDPNSLRYGVHLSLMGSVSTFAGQADAILAFHYLGPSALAVYSFATAIPDRLTGLFKFMPSAALPQFTRRPKEEVLRGLTARIILAVVGMLLIAGAYALIAPLFYEFLFPAYKESAAFSQIYAITMIGIVTQILVAALSAHEKVRSLYVYNVGLPILQVALQFFGIIFFGLWGLVISRVAGSIIALCLTLTLTINAFRERII